MKVGASRCDAKVTSGAISSITDIVSRISTKIALMAVSAAILFPASCAWAAPPDNDNRADAIA
jgi:hypothetical protein